MRMKLRRNYNFVDHNKARPAASPPPSPSGPSAPSATSSPGSQLPPLPLAEPSSGLSLFNLSEGILKRVIRVQSEG